MRTEALRVSFTCNNWLLGIAFSIALAACGAASAQTTSPQASGTAGWRWSVTPYLWGSDLKGDVTFPSGQSIGGELKFNDILDHLDFAAMLHVEGHRREWGMFFDATYLSMSDDTTHGPISSDADIKFGMYELAAVFTPGAAAGPFSAFAGVRFVDMTLDMVFSGPGPIGPVSRSANKSYADFLIGARYVFSFSERWALSLRGDVGFGDTEQDWNATAMVGWRFGRQLNDAVLVGYRHLDVEVEEDGRKTEVQFDGPFLGVMFGW